MTQPETTVEYDPRHPHERDGREIAPVLDHEGGCLICRVDVRDAEIERLETALEDALEEVEARKARASQLRRHRNAEQNKKERLYQQVVQLRDLLRELLTMEADAHLHGRPLEDDPGGPCGECGQPIPCYIDRARAAIGERWCRWCGRVITTDALMATGFRQAEPSPCDHNAEPPESGDIGEPA